MKFSIRNKLIDNVLLLESVPQSARDGLFQIMYQDFSGGRAINRLYPATPLDLEAKFCRRLGIHLNVNHLNNKLAIIEQVGFYLHGCKYYEVYDAVEVYLELLDENVRDERIKELNNLFSDSQLGYRVLINGQCAKITNDLEVEELNRSICSKYDRVNSLFKEAISHFSKNDYNASVAKSFCALETLLSIVLNEKGTFSELIKKFENKRFQFHEALKAALVKLYGYASDVARHGSKDEYLIDGDEARFVLIVSSSLINFLICKQEIPNKA